MSGVASGIDRILFFGTPEFAVPTLAALVAAGRPPVRVITPPARPAGRSSAPQDPPVARWAREHGIEVSQPARVRAPEFLAEAAALAPDVAVVVAFGQIFPPALLDLPRHGCVNLHASLLPRWRARLTSVQAALAAGDGGGPASRRCGWTPGSTPAPSCSRRRRRSLRGERGGAYRAARRARWPR